jgi:elongation factor G
MPLANGETISAPSAPIALESFAAPDPVMRVAIEPVTSDDRERLGLALSRMVAADPSLHVETDDDTGQTLLAGMGKLHLEIAVERLALEHAVAVVAGRPVVAYRTSVRRQARRDFRYAKQTGGPGMFAQITLEVGPAARGAGLAFEDRTRGGAVPREYVKAVEAGVRAAMEHGLLGGHPVVDVRVALIDGQTHPNDSSEIAFRAAGMLAFRDAAADAEPYLLEPIMKLEVSCGDALVGAVVGDVARRRGEVLGIVGGVVRAEVPLAETFDYAGALSALTHGRGRFSLEPARYAEVRK